LEHRTFDICNLILCHRHHHPRLIFAQAALLDNFSSYAQFFFSADLLTPFSDISGLGLEDLSPQEFQILSVVALLGKSSQLLCGVLVPMPLYRLLLSKVPSKLSMIIICGRCITVLLLPS
jgi:hypothetical protein